MEFTTKWCQLDPALDMNLKCYRISDAGFHEKLDFSLMVVQKIEVWYRVHGLSCLSLQHVANYILALSYFRYKLKPFLHK
jgi:hypothetical protein